MGIFKIFVWLVAAAVAGPAVARDFTSSDIYPADYPTVRAVAHLADLMRERSGGRLVVSTLGASDQQTENFTLGELRNGTLDMARVSLAVLNSAVPATAPTIAAMMTRSTPWKCGGDRCVTTRTEGSPLTMCQLAAKELGTLTAFTANGEAFAAEQLAKCNTRAKSA